MRDHTNDMMLDDEGVHTKSQKSSIVITPDVTGKTDCEEWDQRHRRSIHPSDEIPIIFGDEQNQSKNQSDQIARE